jgi:hypothetical protein
MEKKLVSEAVLFCPKFPHELTCYQTQAFAATGQRAKTGTFYFLEFYDIQ